MKIVVFGLSISSAWGNGHATLLRGLFRALHCQGHVIDFFERDTHYYAAHRDADHFPFARLHLYSDWLDVLPTAKDCLASADAAIVTSYCPDGVSASRLVTQARLPRTIFYDMDTPVTLSRLDKGEPVEYLPPEGLGDFDLVLSYTGGEPLKRLRNELHAPCVAPLYGWADPNGYYPVDPVAEFAADLSYLGTYAADRQAMLDELLIRPACALPDYRFLIAGAMFPQSQDRPANVTQLDHVPPHRHRAFFCSSRLSLNVTRGSMAAMGYCPSGRLFEAGACGAPILSDWWTGLDEFFQPGEEILIATSCAEAIRLITADPGILKQIGSRARQRVLDCHTTEIRARQLVDLIESPVDQSTTPERNLVSYKGVGMVSGAA